MRRWRNFRCWFPWRWAHTGPIRMKFLAGLLLGFAAGWVGGYWDALGWIRKGGGV